MPIPADLESRLLEALFTSVGQVPTRHDLAKRFQVSTKAISDVLDPLAVRGTVVREMVRTPRGQQAWGYRLRRSIEPHTDKRGRRFYMATCRCGVRRRLKAVGTYYVLWHAGCGVIEVDVERILDAEEAG